MSRDTSSVIKQSEYEAGKSNYFVQQVNADELKVLIEASERKLRDPNSNAVFEEEEPEVIIDPEVERTRAEADAYREEALELLQDAKREAAAITSNAEEDGEAFKTRAREEGYQAGLTTGTNEGYEEGLKRGQEEGLRQWAELVARWESLLTSTLEEKKQYFRDREQILVKLVFEATAKVLHREIKEDDNLVQTLISAAIKRTSERSRLIVHLNPEDMSRAQEADAASFKRQDGVKQIEYLADESVAKGGVRIETGSETIDASLDLQLARVARSLMEVASNGD